jgi:hypothetical protein
MSVQIPTTGSPPPTTAARGVTIPIGNILPVPQLRTVPVPQLLTSREEKVVRAVAAAAALQDPPEALRLAEQAVEDPATVAGNVIERPKLEPVLAQVSAAVDQGGGPSPTPDQRAAARAVGVDAALVAVAQQGLAADTTCEATREAREWVAMIEPDLLARAARAGLRQQNIDLVPKTAGTAASSRLDTLEGRVKTVEDGQTATTARLDTIEGRLTALEEGQTALTARLDYLEGRVTALEEGKKTPPKR